MLSKKPIKVISSLPIDMVRRMIRCTNLISQPPTIQSAIAPMILKTNGIIIEATSPETVCNDSAGTSMAASRGSTKSLCCMCTHNASQGAAYQQCQFPSHVCQPKQPVHQSSLSIRLTAGNSPGTRYLIRPGQTGENRDYSEATAVKNQTIASINLLSGAEFFQRLTG